MVEQTHELCHMQGHELDDLVLHAAKLSKGISAKFMRHFYKSIAVPKILYALISSSSQKLVGARV